MNLGFLLSKCEAGEKSNIVLARFFCSLAQFGHHVSVTRRTGQQKKTSIIMSLENHK